MRLWHVDLIPVLPKQQLLGQWRECCCIARNIAVNGTPNHLLVNKIMDYPIGHFWRYGLIVFDEMVKRGYRPEWLKFDQYIDCYAISGASEIYEIFPGWHNYRYLIQCFHNLQEKYDCGGISEEELREIIRHIRKKYDVEYDTDAYFKM